MSKYSIQVIPDTAIKNIEIEINNDSDEISIDEIEEMISNENNSLFYEIKKQMDNKYFTILSDAIKI